MGCYWVMNISLIVTVKNEGEAIRPLLDSLIEQSRMPDEIVICDGGSTDHTVQILTEYQQWLPLKIIEASGANISAGRNRAIEAAQGEIVAATDAGVILTPYWVEDLVAPIEKGETAVAAGWFEADPYTDFEVVMGATVLPALEDIDPKTFLPSSRSVAFLKSAWATVGGYPEWLDYSEDLVFDMALRDAVGEFVFVETAVAYFRPRGSLRAFSHQYYNYAKGDGKASLWPKRHAIRYVTYLAALPALLYMIWRDKRIGWLGLGLGTAVYCKRPAQRLWPDTTGWRPPARLRAFAMIPIIRFVGDVAKMVGYLVGVFWRWKRP